MFPGNDRHGRFGADGLDSGWQILRAREGLEDARLNDMDLPDRKPASATARIAVSFRT